MTVFHIWCRNDQQIFCLLDPDPHSLCGSKSSLLKFMTLNLLLNHDSWFHFIHYLWKNVVPNFQSWLELEHCCLIMPDLHKTQFTKLYLWSHYSKVTLYIFKQGGGEGGTGSVPGAELLQQLFRSSAVCRPPQDTSHASGQTGQTSHISPWDGYLR